MARRTIRVTHTVAIDLESRRGESFEGIVDSERLKEKLNGGYSLDMAAKFPLYKWFPDVGEIQCVAHTYIPPDNIQPLKPAVTDPGLEELLFDNLPAWAAFPEKKTAATSFTCRKTAVELSRISEVQGYHPGRIFRVVPISGARIVVAPHTTRPVSRQRMLDRFPLPADRRNLVRPNNWHHAQLKLMP